MFENDFSEIFLGLPVNYDQYIKFMEIDEWPGKLTSETILSLREELSEYQDIDFIENELETDINLNFAQLDNFEKNLKIHEKYLMNYANKLLNVPSLLYKSKDLVIAGRKEIDNAKQKNEILSNPLVIRASYKEGETKSLEELNLKSVDYYEYPGYNVLEFNELPGVMDAVSAMKIVVKYIKFSKQFRPIWWKIYVSQASVGIVHDLFWWCFLDSFKTEKNDNNKEELFCRIALNFGLLLLSISDEIANKFLPLYPEILAMTLYTIFYQAFPLSRNQFGPNFKQKLINNCHLFITGLQPLPNSFNTWPIHKLQKSLEMSGEPSLIKTLSSDSLEPGFKVSRVLFDPKACSPLIHKFLQLHNIDVKRSDSFKCIPRIELNRSNEQLPSITDMMKKYNINKVERQSQRYQNQIENEKQIEKLSKQRRELELRFHNLQKEIDSCSGILDMRKLLHNFSLS